jgi:hypothetical protein
MDLPSRAPSVYGNIVQGGVGVSGVHMNATWY